MAHKHDDMKKSFQVCMSKEYIIEVEAANADHAIQRALEIDVVEWDLVSTDINAEELEEDDDE